ncbi:MAG: MFS transporter [Candidatus Kariarchaeaceae archaeon]|jgi:MFS family permease
MAIIYEKFNRKKSDFIIFNFTSQEWKFFVHYIVSRFWALAGIWVIFLAANGLTLTEVAIVESVYMGSMFLAEIPTGVVADKFGRKNSLLLAYFTQFVGILMFAFSTSILMFGIAFAIWGIGQTMTSGADQAWLYDEIKFDCHVKEKDVAYRYQRVYGLLLSVGLLSTASSYVVGGYLARSDLRYPIVLTAFMFLASTIWLFSIKENRIVEDKEEKVKSSTELKQALKNFKSYNLMILTLTSMIIGGIVTAFFYWMQPFLAEKDVEVANIGWFLGAGVLLASFGSTLSTSLNDKFKHNSLLVLVIGSSAAFLLMSVVPYFGVIILFFFIRFLRGALNPYLSRLINQSIPTHGRATTLSIISALTTFAIMIITLTSAYMIDLVNFQLFYISSGILILITTPFILKNRQEPKKGSINAN